MITLDDAHNYVGQQIRSDHPYSYRTGQWATIVDAAARKEDGRVLWSLLWPDGARDVWVVNDPTADYEFRETKDLEPTLGRALTALKGITLAVKADVETPGIRAPRVLRDQLVGILSTWGEAEENA